MQVWQTAFKALYHFDCLESTQDFIQQQIQQHAPLMAFCRADVQTKGRGQRERVWQAERGQLLFSFSFPLADDYEQLAGITQALALAMVESLDPAAQALCLKWPNDIYLADKKLAGILVESKRVDKALWLIVGVGINLAPQGDFAGLNEAKLRAEHWHADEVLNHIMPAMLACLARWQSMPYLPLQHRWQVYDKYHHRKALCEQLGEVVILGIDQRGRLLVQHDDGKMQAVINTRILGGAHVFAG